MNFGQWNHFLLYHLLKFSQRFNRLADPITAHGRTQQHPSKQSESKENHVSITSCQRNVGLNSCFSKQSHIIWTKTATSIFFHLCFCCYTALHFCVVPSRYLRWLILVFNAESQNLNQDLKRMRRMPSEYHKLPTIPSLTTSGFSSQSQRIWTKTVTSIILTFRLVDSVVLHSYCVSICLKNVCVLCCLAMYGRDVIRPLKVFHSTAELS